ncbi:MAG: hypothetical protein KA248_11335 [Kiritimatiellae bacterium]|nr:hypothetical protein [Kiritimatiellia bacterium]
MDAKPRPAIYRLLKWTWLLAQGVMPALAAVHLVRSLPAAAAPESFSIPRFLHQGALALSGAVTLILWLMAEALLCMYRFPLRLGGAIILAGGFAVQFIALAWSGDSVFFAAYTGLYVTLAALTAAMALLAGAALRRRVRNPTPAGPPAARWALGLTAVMAMIVLALAFLFPPLRAGIAALPPVRRWIGGLALLANTVSTLRLLVDFSIWGRPDPRKAEFDREWEHWAAPTIVILILGATAAIMAAGILRAEAGSP